MYLLNNTVEPVYGGRVLSGHPLDLAASFQSPDFFGHTNSVFVTCIR